MPYSAPDNVPEQIRKLPVGAQRIWVAAFNSAEKSGLSVKRSARIAWAAVKKKYRKEGDRWTSIDMESHVARLPASVRSLPGAARTIWRKAFVSASRDLDRTAAERVAWAAVEREFRRSPDGEWSPLSKGEGDRVPDRALLREKYGALGQSLIPLIEDVYGQKIDPDFILVASDREFEQLADQPTGSAKSTYAVTLDDRIFFSPVHQRDVAGFDGILTADDPDEIQAVKALVHELIHVASPVQSTADRIERILLETLTEIQAVALVASRVPFEGNRDELIRQLNSVIFYAGRFPWMGHVLVVLAGSARDAVAAGRWLVMQPSKAIADYVLTGLEERMDWRPVDTRTFVGTQVELYDDHQREMEKDLEERAGKITDGEDPVIAMMKEGDVLMTSGKATGFRTDLEDSRESARRARKARAGRYGIAVLDQGHVTKPGKWSSVPDSQFGDPVNYRYPMPDKSHAANAKSRFQQETGDYRGRSVVRQRINRRLKHFGLAPVGEETGNMAIGTSAPTTALQTSTGDGDRDRDRDLYYFGPVSLEEDGSVPEWVTIHRVGEYDHERYGHLTFTPDKARRSIANFYNRVHRPRSPVDMQVPVDTRHSGDPASGWLTDMRYSSPYLLGRVAWTPRGEKIIRDRSYLYISPRYHERDDIGPVFKEITLTNRDFLKMPPVGTSIALSDDVPDVPDVPDVSDVPGSSDTSALSVSEEGESDMSEKTKSLAGSSDMAQVMALLQSLLAALMEGSPEDSGLGGFLRFRGARQRGLPGGDDGLGGFLRFRGGRRWGLFTRKIAPVLEAKDTGEFIRALENVVVAIDGSRPRVMNSEDAFVLEVAPGQTVQLTGEQVRSLVAERRETAAKTHQMRLDAAVTKAVERGVPPAILNPVRALMQVAEDGDGEGAGDITLEGVDGTFSPFGVLVHLLENCPSRLGEASEGITGEKPENAEEETGTMSFEEAEEHERKRRRELVQSGWLPGRVTEDAEI